MKLYFSFGYVGEDDKSVRLYHMEQPLTANILHDLVDSIRDLLGGIVKV